MERLDARELLDLWERGLTQSTLWRAVALLRAAWPTAPEGDVLEWPLGLRDARLLALRRRLFGSDLTLVTACASCGEPVESSFGVEDVLLDPDTYPSAAQSGTTAIERLGYTVVVRVPTTRDLLAIVEAQTAGPAAARERLLARCVIDVRGLGGALADLSSLPPAVIADIGHSMAIADPQADVQLVCACPSCGDTWHAVFDIAAVLWAEIHAWARHLLRDVHVLARAYGWGEGEVLALSPSRRRMYLELVAP